MIFDAINKPIISIKKFYQALIDVGEPYTFHIKCDNKNNTLVVIQSKNNERFGGFTSNFWESKTINELNKDYKNAFPFSLDK